MFRSLIRLISPIIFWVIFLFVLFKAPYPDTIASATTAQLLAFFIPLFLSITLTLNVFFKNIYTSASISLGVIFLLILKALDSLNIVTSLLIIIAIYLLVSYIKKSRKSLNPIKSSLTNWPKIPKITKLKKGN